MVRADEIGMARVVWRVAQAARCLVAVDPARNGAESRKLMAELVAAVGELEKYLSTVR